MVIAAYTASVCIKQKGVPYSISSTYYKLEHKHWFMFTMFMSSGLLMPAIFEFGNTDSEWAAFLACAGMFMVGSSPNFRSGTEGLVHDAGAVLSLVFSQVWVLLNAPYILFVWLVYIVCTIIHMATHGSDRFVVCFTRTKPMFWIEVTALASTYLSVFLLND